MMEPCVNCLHGKPVIFRLSGTYFEEGYDEGEMQVHMHMRDIWDAATARRQPQTHGVTISRPVKPSPSVSAINMLVSGQCIATYH